MPLLDYVRYEEANADIREALADSMYADSEDRHLFYEMLSNSPAAVSARTTYFKQLMTNGTVPEREKELAYFTVGLTTDTRFVAATHGRYLIDEYGYTETAISKIARGEFSILDGCDRAIVLFSRKVIQNPAAVSQSDLDLLYDHGYDDADVMELLLLICDAQTATRIVSVTEMELADRGESDPAFLPNSFDI